MIQNPVPSLVFYFPFFSNGASRMLVIAENCREETKQGCKSYAEVDV